MGTLNVQSWTLQIVVTQFQGQIAVRQTKSHLLRRNYGLSSLVIIVSLEECLAEKASKTLS